MLEERGLPTTVLALVLPQVEKTRPPRALMTPFVLGRPFGEPGDSDFQRRVLLQALRLLERTDGPVILEHFADDAPSGTDRPGWESAVKLPPLTVPSDWEAAFRDELELVIPVWVHSGQTGARMTALTWSACSAAAIPSAASTIAAGSVDPMTL